VKRILCTGKVVNGGAVEITRPTLDEQIAINAELIAMNRDLDALLAGKPLAYRLTPAQVAEIENERPGEDYCTRPWAW
jgi:hypothetical protein